MSKELACQKPNPWMQVKPEWPSEYPDVARKSTKLFLVDDGGERWWVSAHTPERAVGVILAHMGEGSYEWEQDPPDVREVDRDEDEGNFTFEDGAKCKMWNAFELVRGFEVLLATTLI